MKLFYSKGACSLSVRILLHELNIAAEYEAVNLKTKKTETDQDFLAINPRAAVPTLQLDNHQVLTENVAIQLYLADNHPSPLLAKPEDFNRYRAIEMLSFVATDLHKNFSPIFNAEFSEDIKEKFKAILEKKFNFLNNHLKANQFLVGDSYSLPDGYCFVVLRWANHFKFDFESKPNIKRYFEALKKRPSIQQSLKEEGLL